MAPDAHDPRRSFLDKAKRHMNDGKWPELLLAMDAVIRTSRGDDLSRRDVLMVAHRMRGHALARMSRFDEAVSDFRRALDLSKAMGDQANEAMSLDGLGGVSYSMGDTDLALDFFKSGLELAREIGDAAIEAQVLIGIANTDINKGHYEEAIAGLKAAIDILSKMEPSEPLARAYNNRGETLGKLGRNDDALWNLTKAVEVAEKIGNLMAKGFAKMNLGIIYARTGRLDRAKQLMMSAIADLGRAHDQAGLVEATGAHGMILGLEGNCDLALQEIRKAEMMAMRDGLDGPRSEVLVHKARIMADMKGDFVARTAYSEAITLLRDLGNDGRADELEKEMAGLGNGSKGKNGPSTD